MLKKNYVVKSKDLKETKKGKPYISLILNPATNPEVQVDGKIWSEAVDRLNNRFKPGDIIKIIDGKEEEYNNAPQLVINDLEVVEEKTWGLELEESKDLYYTLLDIIETTIKNEQVKMLTLNTLNKYSKLPLFYQAPAAKSHHHNYPGGLLKHTVELCQIAVAIKATQLYPKIEWDIVLGACALHDLGKIHDYALNNYTVETTEIIRLTGHVVTTSLEIFDTAKSMGIEYTPVFNNLLHAVIAHHGKKEWGSPQEPATKEAWMVHLIDMMSSKISD